MASKPASIFTTAPELGARLDSASGLSGECVRTLQTQRCDDVLVDSRVDVAASQRLGVRSVTVMPLLRAGELAGVFELFSSLPGAFGERDERTLEALAGRVLSHLVLSTAEQTEPPPTPVTEIKSEQVVTVPVPPYEPPADSALIASENLPDLIGGVPHIPDHGSGQRGFDFVTTFVGAAVLACAILLGVLLGQHFVFRKAAVRVQPVAPISKAVAPAPAVETSLPSAESSVNSAAPVAPVKVEGDTIPPGSLRVFENGKEVFRQSATPTGSAPKQGSGMQRAAQVVLEDGGQSAAVSGDSVLHRVEPEYPDSAREMHVQGSVVLDVRIGQDGGVQEMSLVSGQPLLVQAAKDAVRQWRFKPSLVNGNPATMQTRITLNFRLP
jgi:protein TonB